MTFGIYRTEMANRFFSSSTFPRGEIALKAIARLRALERMSHMLVDNGLADAGRRYNTHVKSAV